MQKKSLKLIDEEVSFGEDEMFISRTDLRGVIQSGNDVFVRVSGYDWGSLFGRPHNIIRHPDMPKAVFKLFWSVVQQGETIAAYVKNRAIDGRYYWVMALAFPIQSGYLSIRIKPRSELFKAVKPIYEEMLKIENQDGVDAATQFLLLKLRESGFASYESFMFAALKAEYDIRDASLHQRKSEDPNFKSITARTFQEIKNSLDYATVEFKETMTEIGKHSQIQNDCYKKSEAIAQSFSRLGDLSVNMSISAHKLGKEGGTLAVVANTFQSTSLTISTGFESFQRHSTEVSENLNKVGLSIICARLQIEMLSFFLGEGLAKMAKVSQSEAKNVEKQICGEMGELIAAIQNTFQKGNQLQIQFMDLIQRFSKEARGLRGLIARLDLIRTGGKLEGSRTNKTFEIFRPFIHDMGEFVSGVGVPMGEIERDLEELCLSYGELVTGTRLLDFTLSEVALLYRTIEKSLGSNQLQQAI